MDKRSVPMCLLFRGYVCTHVFDLSPLQLGGTIGDIEGMPFVEAFRQFQFRVGLENFCNIHVSLVPQVNTGCPTFILAVPNLTHHMIIT